MLQLKINATELTGLAYRELQYIAPLGMHPMLYMPGKTRKLTNKGKLRKRGSEKKNPEAAIARDPDWVPAILLEQTFGMYSE